MVCATSSRGWTLHANAGQLRALLGTALFALFAFQVYRRRESDPARMKPEKRLFKYSILYLFVVFGALVVDRWVLP